MTLRSHAIRQHWGARQGGSGNISSLELRWETLAFIGNKEELKQFVRICLNMLSLQHAGLRPVLRTVTLRKALFYRFSVRPYLPPCLRHMSVTASQSLLRVGRVRGLQLWRTCVAAGREPRCVRSIRNSALRACLV